MSGMNDMKVEELIDLLGLHGTRLRDLTSENINSYVASAIRQGRIPADDSDEYAAALQDVRNFLVAHGADPDGRF
jgi:hypothetical protein